MTITYPLNLLDSFPGWSVEFDLLYRQEFSRTAGGVTIAKDLGTPLWQATYQTRSLNPNELDAWRARLKGVEGSVQRFTGWPSSRCYPIAYPKGTGMGPVDAVTVASVGADNKSVTLSDLPAGYTARVGDYMQIGTKLYQIVSVDTDFEVRPHMAPGTAVGNSVILVQPAVPMIIIPGSLSSTVELATGRGAISFQAVESR